LLLQGGMLHLTHLLPSYKVTNKAVQYSKLKSETIYSKSRLKLKLQW
jgi:hypothetical protein